jgi:dolichol-phosphate mannosyltransferase
MNVTVVIPTYNEAENLPRLVSTLFSLPLDHLQILVIDDNSPDGTGRVADSLAEEFPGEMRVVHRSGKYGLGSAYLQGFRLAMEGEAEAIGQMDADLSHSPNRLLDLIAALENSDIALGSRYVQGGSLDEQWPIWRKGLSAFGNLYARSILGLPIRDVTGGYRVWRQQTLRAMPLHRVRSNGYAFLIEMTFIAYRLGFNFVEVPIYFADRRWGDSKMSFRVQVEAAFRVLMMRANYKDLEPIVDR